MKAHPILFNTEMVQAILDGRKTQTRRICKHQYWSHSELTDVNRNGIFQKVDRRVSCPYGNVGDVLWVRETWCLTTPYGPEEYYFGYKTSSQTEIKASEKYNYYSPDEWKPSIHMPKEACRIFLRITNIRVERLQDISEDDAIKEGVQKIAYGYKHYTFKGASAEHARHSFLTLWKSINGSESWEANPWVWVIEFERTVKPENF
jgi:hypothetical protein